MHFNRSPLKNLFARGLLALAFLFAQQHAALHWLSHAVDATRTGQPSADKTTPNADHCDECLALGALGGAATGGDSTIPAIAARPVQVASPALTSSPAALRLAFRSRAPPILT